MRDTELFQMALGLTPSWQVESCEFDPERKRIDIMIHCRRGGTFACPECGKEELKAYDTEMKVLAEPEFFQHEAYLTGQVPRVKCSKCGIRLANVPWARSGSGFTLLFAAMIMTLAKAMPVKTTTSVLHITNSSVIHDWFGVHYCRPTSIYSEVNRNTLSCMILFNVAPLYLFPINAQALSRATTTRANCRLYAAR